MLGAGAAVQPLYRRWAAAPARLLEQAQVLVATDVQRELPTPKARRAGAGPGAADQRAGRPARPLRRDIADEVAQASRGIEQERNRLAALMSELTQSVVVCNLDGRILLYNNRARLQFRALSDAPTLAGGAELIGLGRSIYTVFDRKLVAHALDSVQQRLQRGAAIRARSSSPPRAAASCCARRWRRCAASPTTRAGTRRPTSPASC
jgi:DNA polymerase III subunit epsilon